jgi:hypothetical protein
LASIRNGVSIRALKCQETRNVGSGKFAEARQKCSAELNSAVSPICNRQDVQGMEAAGISRIAEFNSAIRQIKNLRYG